MINYLMIGLGGACGSLVRFELGRRLNAASKRSFPFSTLLINVTGAFLLGLVSGLHVGQSVSLLLADGFLGAYTTFSTFMFEGFSLFQDKKRLNALIYILGTAAIGFLFYAAGSCAAKLLSQR